MFNQALQIERLQRQKIKKDKKLLPDRKMMTMVVVVATGTQLIGYYELPKDPSAEQQLLNSSMSLQFSCLFVCFFV